MSLISCSVTHRSALSRVGLAACLMSLARVRHGAQSDHMPQALRLRDWVAPGRDDRPALPASAAFFGGHIQVCKAWSYCAALKVTLTSRR